MELGNWCSSALLRCVRSHQGRRSQGEKRRGALPLCPPRDRRERRDDRCRVALSEKPQELLFFSELAIRVVSIAHRANPRSSLRYAAMKFLRPRAKRDFTVSSGLPSITAISPRLNPAW